MRCSLALIAAVASLATASGQFFSFPSTHSGGGFLQRRQSQAVDGGSVTSSSFRSSVSWFQGQDGQMHKQTEETQNQVVQDGSNVKETNKKVLCRDGRCQETVQIAYEDPAQAQPTMQQHPCPYAQAAMQDGSESVSMVVLDDGMPLRNVLEYLWGHMAGTIQRQQALLAMERQQQPPERNEMIIIGLSPEMENGPSAVIQAVPVEIQAVPVEIQAVPVEIQSDWRRQDRKDMLEKIEVMEARPQAPETYAQHWLRQHRQTFQQRWFMPLMGASLFAFVVSMSYVVVIAILQCRRSDAREAAIERPLQSLGESLLTDSPDHSVMLAASAQTRKVAAVPMYLKGLYARASAKSESAAVRNYMLSLYKRVVG